MLSVYLCPAQMCLVVNLVKFPQSFCEISYNKQTWSRTHTRADRPNKKLITRWDSERELFYDDIVHALQINNTYRIGSAIPGVRHSTVLYIVGGSSITNPNAKSNPICNPNLTLILPDPGNGGPLNPERLPNRTANLALTLFMWNWNR